MTHNNKKGHTHHNPHFRRPPQPHPHSQTPPPKPETNENWIDITIAWTMGWLDGCILSCLMRECKECCVGTHNNDYMKYMQRGFRKGFRL